MSSRQIQDDEAATGAEVRQAMVDLEPSSLSRLREFARIRSLGLDETGDDLVQMALMTTLEGKRRWKRSIPFWLHLKGAIKSISNHAREKMRPTLALEPDQDSGERPTDDRTIASIDSGRELLLLEKALEGDAEAELVLEGIKEGMGRGEIEAMASLSPKEYEAALKRIRRKSANRKRETR